VQGLQWSALAIDANDARPAYVTVLPQPDAANYVGVLVGAPTIRQYWGRATCYLPRTPDQCAGSCRVVASGATTMPALRQAATAWWMS
jgi:hypothetical protein